MSLPWIKLFCEMLEDPKMGRMSEWLFCRCVKLFLMAGREGKEGMLPPVEDIAWSLRLDEDKTAQTLRDLAEVGVTHQTVDGSWWITNFSKRQAISDGAKRTREYRERLKQQAVTVTSHVMSPVSTSTSASDSSSDSSSDSFGFVFKAYEQNFGAITPMIAESVADSVKEYSAEWVMAALEDSVKANVRKWSYAEAILRRWKVDGFRSPGPGKNGTGKKPKKEYDYEALREKAKKEGL
ncbi:MAG: DnaD domain protein [Anaerolineales bacterium]|nr:DnaD domain protein [Anaerolineales bacterium]